MVMSATCCWKAINRPSFLDIYMVMSATCCWKAINNQAGLNIQVIDKRKWHLTLKHHTGKAILKVLLRWYAMRVYYFLSSSIWDRAIRYTDSGFHRNSADWSVSGVRHYHPYLKQSKHCGHSGKPKVIMLWNPAIWNRDLDKQCFCILWSVQMMSSKSKQKLKFF